MRFSVLLPTRNGGRFIKDCIASVTNQSFNDFELIISDNASTNETVEAIQKFMPNKNIKYLRLERVVPVTDNWNNALNASSGDYFLMIGDDDCLLPGYFETMNDLIKKLNYPDCIHYQGYLYIFPEAVHGNKNSYYDPTWGYQQQEGELSKELRLRMVKSFFKFKGGFQFNSQLTLVSRRILKKVKNGFYRAPFPDFYSACVLLLDAEKFFFIPRKLVIVGISPKSAGYYHYNQKNDEFLKYLSSTVQYNDSIHSSALFSSELQWLEILQNEYTDRLSEVSIDFKSYLKNQSSDWCRQYALGYINFYKLLFNSKYLSISNWLFHFFPRMIYRFFNRWKREIIGRPSRLKLLFPKSIPVPKCSSIKDFANWITQKSIAMNESNDVK